MDVGEISATEHTREEADQNSLMQNSKTLRGVQAGGDGKHLPAVPRARLHLQGGAREEDLTREETVDEPQSAQRFRGWARRLGEDEVEACRRHRQVYGILRRSSCGSHSRRSSRCQKGRRLRAPPWHLTRNPQQGKKHVRVSQAKPLQCCWFTGLAYVRYCPFVPWCLLFRSQVVEGGVLCHPVGCYWSDSILKLRDFDVF